MRTAQHETRERTRVISGSVNSDGALKSGTGFVVSRGSAGVYSIRWTFPVKQVINVVLTTHTGIGFPTVTTDWTPYGIQVVIWNPAVSAGLDSDFGFTATVIPR